MNPFAQLSLLQRFFETLELLRVWSGGLSASEMPTLLLSPVAHSMPRIASQRKPKRQVRLPSPPSFRAGFGRERRLQTVPIDGRRNALLARSPR